MAMHAHPDGDAHEVRFVADLLPVVRARVPGPRLGLGDRAFCNLEQVDRFCAEGDHGLVRRRRNASFEPDPTRSPQTGRDTAERTSTEAWGWPGKRNDPRGRYVRQITLERSGEEPIFLVTDLPDAACHPASDLLLLSMSRWGIERMFQQVTEVFGWQALLGGSPQATIFQFAFCLVLYNIIQVVRSYVGAAQHRPCGTLSSEKLFYDVQRELTAWSVLVSPATTVAYLPAWCSPENVRAPLHQLLDSAWTKRWIKASSPRRACTPRAPNVRSHTSVYRILQEHRQRAGKQPCTG